ncbi:hypothetical protein EQV77_17405 [Halobacillus fulvus]|nr:hypothetical protein EQV77_17405 [Halobacillus fulvus]
MAIIDTYHLGPSCVPWRSTLNQLIEKWYGKKRRAGNSTYAHPLIRHEQVLTESPFKAEVHTLPPYEVIWTVESILGNLYSTSYGAKRFLGQNVGAFEREVEDALANLSEEGLFTETMNVSVKLGLKGST